MRRIRARHFPLDRDLPEIVRLWILRILIPLGGHSQFLRSHGFYDEGLAEALGLGDPFDDAFNAKAALNELRRLHREAERRPERADLPASLTHNVARLADLAGLSLPDCRILEFAALLHQEKALDAAADTLGELPSRKVVQVLAAVLDLPEAQVREALSGRGRLARSGLLTLDRDAPLRLAGKLELLSEPFAEQLVGPEADPVGLLHDMVAPAPAPTLSRADFAHIAPELALLTPYLKRALETARSGVNIYLYGAPGTGKTELARLLAAELGCALYAVADEDAERDAVDGAQRLRAYCAAQSFFARRRALILFDEVEDVFDRGVNLFAPPNVARSRKAWMHRLLEENPLPALWVSNSVEGVDAASMRRFDQVIELPVPPRRQRERIVQAACAGLLDGAAVGRIAESEALAPAVIARAASVVQLIRADLDEEALPQALERLLSASLEAQGHAPLPRGGGPERELYDPAFTSTDRDLEALAAGLARSRAGRLCLYGPPGTGKSAFARWLAEQLDLPLMVRRASDLLSMWVGGTERNLARAFRDAEREGALLLIDEVDGLLRDRRGAERPWEVTEVNELLTQMESYPGVFVATTNLMEGLDPAALRRFDLKLRFDYLAEHQALGLLERYCTRMGLGEVRAALAARLARLDALTPGDFAAVARQGRFSPLAGPADLVAALERECALKDNTRNIGFL